MTVTADGALAISDAGQAMQKLLLTEHLAHWAAVDGDRTALTFMDYSTSRSGIAKSATYAELDRRASAMAARLQLSVPRGERVAILAPQGLEYIVAFLGALRAGVVAVPLFSPDLPGHGDRLEAVFADCDPVCAVSTSENSSIVQAFIASRPTSHAIVEIVADEVDEQLAGSFRPVGIQAGDIAYIQYTSGSTRIPAGVLISQTNVVANSSQAIIAYRGTPGNTNLVSWLPLFHDMGLVFVTGGCVVGGLHAVFMDPVAFLVKPARWLQNLSDYPGTISMAPNFAYDYCAKRVSDADKKTLHMENIAALVNGAEPVLVETLARFNNAFAPLGLRPNVVRPSYGLAEATVYVCGTLEDEPAHETVFDFGLLSKGTATTELTDGAATSRLAACGTPYDQVVAIASPETGTHLADGNVGEIWVHGPNVGQGYWNKPQLSRETFGLTLAEARGVPTGPWVRTGDLGVIHDGELYVTGRIKDLIILGGRNHYPQDFEETAEAASDAVGRHRTAAFPVQTDEGEGVVIVAEISRHVSDGEWDPASVTKLIRKAVSNRHSVSVTDIVLVAPNEVPRTSSGKIARGACRQRYLDGELALAGVTS